jgi:hypothetical protein
MTPRGKKFVRAPREEQYGTAAVFESLYGKKQDLLQPKALTAYNQIAITPTSFSKIASRGNSKQCRD